MLTNTLERERIERAVPGVAILDVFELGLRELRVGGMAEADADREVAVRAAERAGVREAVVPGDFPVGLADALRERGVVLRIDDELVARRRRVKTPAELLGITTAQRAAEAAMFAARGLLAEARPFADGRLERDGTILEAEHLRATMRRACLGHGCTLPSDVIVASRWSGYGHDPGSGPLPAALPITIDIWPRHQASGCWADMTRSFLAGTPDPAAAEIVAGHASLVREALEAARAAVRPGATGAQLHGLVSDLFEAAGYLTQRRASAAAGREGFRFSLGHGVGLEVHEAPSVGLAGSDPLVAGDVLALEPGLWDAQVGEVRLEDLVLVTDDGCETLTRFPYDLALDSRS